MQNPWWTTPTTPPSESHATEANVRQAQLTKPPGSLGRLETVAVRLAALQQTSQPHITQPWISVFAGDHGIATAGVSAFPQAVTVEMQRNFVNGGAAISVLARQAGARLEIVNAGSHADESSVPGAIHEPVAPQTQNFMNEPAMTDDQWDQAMTVGQNAVGRAHAHGADLFVGGEMGIGNTASATAIFAALLDIPVGSITGPGTGLDQAGVERKAQMLEQALEHHRPHLSGAHEISCRLGGFEIVALAGAYIAAAQHGIAVVVDGFICTAAAAIATQLNPTISPYLFFSHCSAETAHQDILQQMAVTPLIDLGLRLGEGSGAALCIPLLQTACALHNDMATFEEAAVSNSTS